MRKKSVRLGTALLLVVRERGREGGKGMQNHPAVCTPLKTGKPAVELFLYFHELSRGIASHICGMPPVFMHFLRVH